MFAKFVLVAAALAGAQAGDIDGYALAAPAYGHAYGAP
ncbi:hypothetical protein BIW11_08484, partial [Tropilaelaps mercedesae]